MHLRHLVPGALLWPMLGAAATLPPVTITAVLVDTNSVKIRFAPVPGAVDYRIYDVTNPAETKYAGLVHVYAPWGTHYLLAPDSPAGAVNGDEHVALPLQTAAGDFTGAGFDSNNPEVANVAPYHAAIPNTEIEWNGLTHGVPATLVVEAVSAPGPAVPQNLTNDVNAHAIAGGGALLPAYGDSHRQPGSAHPVSPSDTGHGFGADRGPTPDGHVSTNGQISYCSGLEATAHMQGMTPPAGAVCGDTAPVAIAASAPFTVTATAVPPLPSGPDADPAQLVYDRFDGGVFSQHKVTNSTSGRASFLLTTQTAQWRVNLTDVDLDASSAFVAGHHYMDVIYDGATAKVSNPTHNNHAVITLSPAKAVAFDGGRILHVTFEVDGQFDGRRWVGVSIAPAAAPLTSWYSFNGPISTANQALFIQMFNNNIARDLMSPDPASPTGAPIDTNLATSWPNYGLRTSPWGSTTPYASGHGLDDRSRFDVFLSETRLRIFEDGRPISDDSFPALPFAKNATIYFPHYLYHTGNEINELATYAPYQTYWMNDVPYSDERHWNNMGYEVLPPTTDWTTIGTRIVMPPGAAGLAVIR